MSRIRNYLFSEDSAWRVIFFGAVLVLVLFVVYWPAMHGGFVCDDENDVKSNVALRSFEGLYAIWTHPTFTAQYYPLSFTTFWLNYQAGGLNPFGYHLVNVLLHAINALLLWRILRVLKIPGAWLAAGLFALHPVNVESVAYISERKNVLSGFFFLCSLLAAIKFWLPDVGDRKTPFEPSSLPLQSPSPLWLWGRSSAGSVANPLGSWKYYALTFVLYVLALLSKTATLPLPAVILLLVWWRRRPTLRDAALLAPLVLAGVAMGLVTMHLESHLVDNSHIWKSYGLDMSWLQRGLLAARDIWFYLGKLVWPHPLIFTYPRWTIHASDWTAWVPVVALAIAVWILWRYRAGWGRHCLFAFAYFVAMLFLVLGFFNVYMFRYTFVCDHFQYLACMGPLTLAAAGVALVLPRWGTQKFAPGFGAAVSGALLLTLSVITWQQAATFANAEILWKTNLSRNPNSAMAAVNLGSCYLGDPLRLNDAMAMARLALRLDPESNVALNNMADVLAINGQLDQAISYYRKALAIRPDYNLATFNLANTLEKSSRFPEAIAAYEAALKFSPDDPQILNNLAWRLATCPDAQCRNGPQAVSLATHACDLSHYQQPLFIGTLAAANAEAGEFASAIGYAKMAMQVANQQGMKTVSARNQQLLEHCYSFGKPYHETPPVRK